MNIHWPMVIVYRYTLRNELEWFRYRLKRKVCRKMWPLDSPYHLLVHLQISLTHDPETCHLYKKVARLTRFLLKLFFSYKFLKHTTCVGYNRLCRRIWRTSLDNEALRRPRWCGCRLQLQLMRVGDVVAFTLGRTTRRLIVGALSKWMGGGGGRADGWAGVRMRLLICTSGRATHPVW